MAAEQWRLPAEWEKQSATLLAWPSAASAWDGADLAEVQQEFNALVSTILPRQDVVLLDHPDAPAAADQLPASQRLHRVAVPYNDTWCRDYGPVTLVAAGQRLALDFTFNGWGGKHEAARDNRVNQQLAQHELFNRFRFRQHLFELEGGAIDSDGRGAVLINWHCISTRYPNLSRAVLENELLDLLHAERLLNIDIAPLPGDDTDGHIDTIARFIDAETIVFQQGEPQWTSHLREQLEALRTPAGQAYRLIALPAVASPHLGTDGRVLATSYVNFLFINGALLVPQYGDAADHRALEILRPLAGGREVIGLSARAIIYGNGSLHCCAMNLPAALS